VRLLARRPSGAVVLAVNDAGSGVDPRLVSVRVDGRPQSFRYDRTRGRLVVPVGDLRTGRHRLVASVSDYQEAKNTENVRRILPSTRVYRTAFAVS
jgi:hypothetical protein